MTVDDYLARLEPDRQEVLGPVVEFVRSAVPPGYEEAVTHGMPTWSVPLSRLGTTCNGEACRISSIDDAGATEHLDPAAVPV